MTSPSTPLLGRLSEAEAHTKLLGRLSEAEAHTKMPLSDLLLPSQDQPVNSNKDQPINKICPWEFSRLDRAANQHSQMLHNP
ncbi:MAG: hypothetical protein HC780_08190 [Leptolyngbyaceae cyanobacterium CSU_1_3]|nr:hypothetical protein [Leptolyngbyaceae cyanobacterium CSU_1_3]